MSERITIWRFVDGKRGHENQTLGVVNNLSKQADTEVYNVSVSDFQSSNGAGLWSFRRMTFPQNQPDLLIGAGSATHLPMLKVRRSTKAITVVLMAPSIFVRRFFDLCIIPDHDQIRGSNVITTCGALTAIQPGGTHDFSRGLILLGGPSSHFAWDSPSILQAIEEIVGQYPEISWTLSDSRRTPPELSKQLQEHVLEHSLTNCDVHSWSELPEGWLPEKLAESGVVWVSEDSVSMIYEAITSGASTGLLSVPRSRKRSRIYQAVDNLIKQNLVVRWGESTKRLTRSDSCSLNESARIADLILQKYFTPQRKSA